MMDWSNYSSVRSALESRQQKMDELRSVCAGHCDCTISGRYKRDHMTLAQHRVLQELLYELVMEEIAHIDAELKMMGVQINGLLPENCTLPTFVGE